MIFRGVDLARGARSVIAVAVAYLGALAVLWALGLVVRGIAGWLLVLAPLGAWIALRAWRWHRVSVELADDALRYEGSTPKRDFEIPLDRVRAFYFDRSLPGAPLVLALSDGDERVCDELGPSAARALSAHLSERGIATIRSSSGS